MNTTSTTPMRGFVNSRSTLASALLAASLLFAGAAQAQSYMNLTVGGQFAPGVFGQISVGNAAPPPVINPSPVIVGTVIQGAPIMYMHVPENEQHHWDRFCGRYNACGHPVHFVQVDEKNRWWEARREHEDRRDHADRHDHEDNRGHDNRRWEEENHR
jgi:hypothetical protein